MFLNIQRHALAAAISLSLLTACGGSSSSNSSAVTNTAPVATIKASGATVTSSSSKDLNISLNDEIILDASGSSDAEQDQLSYQWSLIKKPANSQLSIETKTASSDILKAKIDQLGEYQFKLALTDSKGAKTEKIITIVANNTAPQLTTVENITFTSLPVDQPIKDITVGSSIILDGSKTTDNDKDAVKLSWQLIEKPANSKASLTINNQVAALVADSEGLFKIKVRAQDTKGAYTEAIYTYNSKNHAPVTVVIADINAENHQAGERTITASVGYNILLNGANSKDSDKNSLTYQWTLKSKPSKSKLVLSEVDQQKISFSPDQEGKYAVELKVTDTMGATSTYIQFIDVNNSRPTANISSNTSPVALPSGPSVTIPLNTPLTVYGSNSIDPNGDALTYHWSIISKPQNSELKINNANATNLTFTGDVAGSYVLRLKVTDSQGAFSEKDLTINIGNTAPVAITDKTFITGSTEEAITVSADLSFDEDGDTLSYQWNIDSQPTGSKAVIGTPNANILNFIPDVAGTYALSLTVSDGKNTNTTAFTVHALSDVAQSIKLNFAPDSAVYSHGLDKLLVVNKALNNLAIIDPFSKVIKNVKLPDTIVSVQLSPNGKLAAVLLDGQVNLIDIAQAKTIHMRTTGGQHTDVFVTDAGMVYVIGQEGGQWVEPSVTRINMYTGDTADYANYAFYGTQKGVYASKINKVFLEEFGLSPSDIDFFKLDPASGDVTATGDSPYHGDYEVGTKLWLNSHQDLIFTNAGTYFYTSTLKYAGRFLKSPVNLLALSSSSNDDELLVLQGQFKIVDYYNSYLAYPSSYTALTGFNFKEKHEFKFPTVESQQSYGISLFHSSTDHHVALVQTGSDQENASGISYYVITR